MDAMAIPSSLSRKLRETLGQDAGDDLVTWLEEERAERQSVRAQLTDLRQELVTMERRLSARIDRVELRVAEAKGDLMKWSFVFWCGAVAAVAALAGVLRS